MRPCPMLIADSAVIALVLTSLALPLDGLAAAAPFILGAAYAAVRAATCGLVPETGDDGEVEP